MNSSGGKSLASSSPDALVLLAASALAFSAFCAESYCNNYPLGVLLLLRVF